MKKLLLFIALSAIVSASFAQQSDKQFFNFNDGNLRLTNTTSPQTFELPIGKIKSTIETPFINFSAKWQELENVSKTNTKVFVRFSADNSNWQDWQLLTLGHEADNVFNSTVSSLLYLDNKTAYYQLKIETNQLKKGSILNNAFVNFFSPGYPDKNPSNYLSPLDKVTVFGGTSCPCARPSMTTRVQWGNPQGANMPGAVSTTVTHMIVHHSDGANTSSNWPATVLGIWNYHTGTNGWSDIGYNWLIAPDGTLFEGRQANNLDIVGAHFCGFNNNTMGVCMLGNYMTTDLTPAARLTLVKTLGWKDCAANLNSLGTAFHPTANKTLNIVSGHRDGCATSCPGDKVYTALPSIRTEVNDWVNGGCALVTSVVNIEGVKDFTIAPNPSNNGIYQISIKLANTKTMQFSIFDITGKEIYASIPVKVFGSYSQTLTALKSLPNGTYSIQVSLDKDKFTRSIVLAK